ncbi:ribose-5-phosphate isomerase A [Companilactobacillus nodensis]|uniref:ribose-5-phosphate isomerase n=1 Tax=Companilactobacillus nodensis DSM 19682 = JCM 14932 = NBRC 107160 TaxID=1423775 RepID=A0A0R1KC32_9LACO|nr:ribose-5-phosphate isomerase A [Companilactobacillus nodensis]KRK81109.1 ribose 5-phosphate isomerase [Companilactobacillus nodensis DSM 19682 = JCM 14932 = NBRC 107160]
MEKIIEAAINLIQPKMTVSFGGGSNVGRLLKEVARQKLDITVCTPSEVTKKSCQDLGMQVSELDQIKQIDLGFDGCDSLDENLNALKSNGGIHVFEKIYAQMAKNYIILAPKERLKSELDPDVFLSLEVIEAAIPQVIELVTELGGQAVVRQSSDVAGIVRTRLGNGLVDCTFDNWDNILEIDQKISSFNGVVATSYFHNLISAALLSDGDQVIQKGSLK